MDPSGRNNATYGKKYLSANFSIEIQVALDAAKEFSDTHPRFVGHKAIGYATRSQDETAFQRSLNNTLTIFQSYPQHMIGFDAVGEEDAGYSSLKFIHEYLTNFQKGRLLCDLMTYTKDDDIVPTLENAYESILLAAKRVGHGKGFLKMPYLRQIMKERKVAVEACVVSNQILGYDPDLRNHFAQVYHKEGIPIVLAPDDPGTMGYDTVVVDWYVAYVGWGLELGDLKKIALNSLVYNGLTDAERNVAIEQKWRPSWNEYITKMKNIACARDFAAEAAKENRTVKFVQLLPTEGYESGNVHVYGRNFEVAICKVPKCRFESIGDVNAIYISDRHIVCPAPKCPACAGKSTKVSLKVALDGDNYKQTNLDFSLTFAAAGSKSSFTASISITIIVNFVYKLLP
ncbi:hypothetical protein HELRODRAFT_82370 [Helobdella robusta]|uniref:Adenosine deaminase domain-containing protein n=1 Tax=Helobdella robusta TaxID=6412 RepID=T1G4R4_HELRO|nr:hypothetical protein HELRODRAFT_82370 [Helobdella robusta]ESO01158.1 hypothetical protein HELRODRAFT_82370 [Helobdella robusta]